MNISVIRIMVIIEGEIIKVDSLQEYYQVVRSALIEPGDLLYWDENGDRHVNHATIITGVDKNNLLFSGNTRARFDEPVSGIYEEYLKEYSNKSSLYFIRMKDQVFINCRSSD